MATLISAASIWQSQTLTLTPTPTLTLTLKVMATLISASSIWQSQTLASWSRDGYDGDKLFEVTGLGLRLRLLWGLRPRLLLTVA